MALVAIASDKGAPGVTTASVVLAAVWPRPVLLAECDPAGGDLLYRFLAADGRLDPGRGLLSLAVAARRGLRPEQVWEHTQTLRGGLAVLTGVSTAQQGAGLDPLWGPGGAGLAPLPPGGGVADCGRGGGPALRPRGRPPASRRVGRQARQVPAGPHRTRCGRAPGRPAAGVKHAILRCGTGSRQPARPGPACRAARCPGGDRCSGDGR